MMVVVTTGARGEPARPYGTSAGAMAEKTLFESFALAVLQASRSISEGAQLLGLSWDKVGGIMNRRCGARTGAAETHRHRADGDR